MLAMLTGAEELELDKSEGVKLADALKRVLSYHTSLGMTPQTLAYVHLAMTAGGIYGTRALAYRLRKMDERKKSPANVTPISGGKTQTAPAPATQAATGTGGKQPVSSYDLNGIKVNSPQDLWFEPAKDEL